MGLCFGLYLTGIHQSHLRRRR